MWGRPCIESRLPRYIKFLASKENGASDTTYVYKNRRNKMWPGRKLFGIVKKKKKKMMSRGEIFYYSVKIAAVMRVAEDAHSSSRA